MSNLLYHVPFLEETDKVDPLWVSFITLKLNLHNMWHGFGVEAGCVSAIQQLHDANVGRFVVAVVTRTQTLLFW